MAPSPEGEENHTTLLSCAEAHSCLPPSLPFMSAIPSPQRQFCQPADPCGIRGLESLCLHHQLPEDFGLHLSTGLPARALEKTASGFFVLERAGQAWAHLGLFSSHWLCHQLAGPQRGLSYSLLVMKGLNISHPSWPHLSPSPPTMKVEPVWVSSLPQLSPSSLFLPSPPPLLVQPSQTSRGPTELLSPKTRFFFL